MKIQKAKVLKDFSAMLKLKTVSHVDGKGTDREEFMRFRALFRERFPILFEIGEGWGIGDYGTLIRIPGKHADRPSVLMAHYDVVEADPSSWTHDPFGAEIENGRIYGRGTLDTKCTLLSICEAMEYCLLNGFVPDQDIYLSFGAEEETCGETASQIVTFLKARGVKPDLVLDEGGAVIPEGVPGVHKQAAMIGIAEKGTANYLVSMTEGTGGHTSTPPRHTVAGRLAKAAVAIENHPFPTRISTPVKRMFESMAQEVPFYERPVFENPTLASPAIRMAASVLGGTFNAMVRTTCAVTIMDVSSSYNVLPDKGALGVNVRLLEGDTVESVRADLERIIDDPSIHVDVISGSDPSPTAKIDTPAWETLSQAIRETWKKTVVAPYQMNGGTDARFFSAISDHVYRFSPMIMTREERGTVHGVDESIALDTLYTMIRFYIRLIRKL